MIMLSNMSLANAAIYGLLGYAVVFFGLILLMVLVMVLGKIFAEKKKPAAARNKISSASVTGVLCLTTARKNIKT